MQTRERKPLQVMLSSDTDRQLRFFAVECGEKFLTPLVEAMIRHCLESRHFRAKYAQGQGTEKAIDY